VLDRVQAVAVHAGVLHPLHGVVHREGPGRVHGEVEGRQVVGEPAAGTVRQVVPGAAHTADAVVAVLQVGPEPVGVLLVDGALGVHVVHHVVEKHLDPRVVGRLDHLLQQDHGAESGLHLGQVRRPVAVVAGVVVRVLSPHAPRLRRIHRGREPDGVHPELGEVALVQLLQDAGEVAPQPVRGGLHVGRGPVVGGIPVLEAIGEHEVEHRVAPVKDQGVRGRAAAGRSSSLAGPHGAGEGGENRVEPAVAVAYLVGVRGVRDPALPSGAQHDPELVEDLGVPRDGGRRLPRPGL
jgi:hypothetical protein